MNYIQEINAFYDWLVYNPIPADAQALWFALMHINNKCAWRQEFTVANITLLSMLGFSRQQLDRMRNVLIQTGRIQYVKRTGRQAGVYKIIPFVPNNVTQVETQAETQMETQPVTQVETQVDTQSGHNGDLCNIISTLNKHSLNKTKLNSIYIPADSMTNDKVDKKPVTHGKPQKVKYAEFVSMTNDEYQKLLAAYGEENVKRMIEVLDNYKGATGKKYKSDYRAILNWVVDKVMREEKRYAVNNGNTERQYRQGDKSPEGEKREDKLFTRGLA